MSEDAGYAQRFLCAVFATVVKPISDLRLLISGLFVLLFALSVPAQAQQAKKVWRIGVLSGGYGAQDVLFDAFRQGLRDLGWVEGKQVRFELRYAEGQLDKLSSFAAELVRLKVDVIVTTGNLATSEAKSATTTIPIVMASVQQPVSTGLVASLARPGANVTGLTIDVTPEQAGKNLELLKEAVPRASRVAILRRTNVPTHVTYSKEAERVSKILGITVQFAEVQARNDKALEDALGAVVHERANALLIPPSAFFAARRQQIVDFAARNKLPAIYTSGRFVDAGGLMSYGPNVPDLWRQASTYVDKILKGTKPADLPVEQPRKFEFVVNLKTAKQIGLTIPQWTLTKADRVIK